MARRTKADKINIDVEAALKDALDFSFDDDALRSQSIKDDLSQFEGEKINNVDALLEELNLQNALENSSAEDSNSELFDLESLEQQMALAAEEFVADTKQADFDGRIKASKTNTVDPRSNKTDASNTFMDAVTDEFAMDSFLADSKVQSGETSKRPVPRVGSLSKKNKFNVSLSETEGVKIDNRSTRVSESKDEGTLNRFQLANGVKNNSSVKDNGALNLNNSFSDGAEPAVHFGHSLRSDQVGVSYKPHDSSEGGYTSSVFALKSKKQTKLGKIFWSTTTLSALWLIGGGVTFINLASGRSLGEFLTSGSGLLVGAGTIVPILMFFGFAQLARRARELKDAVDEINIAARRLLEPELDSQNRVQSLGFSIRQEVAAMGDGIDRTISRASELEALLQSEVNNLEQAYSENENRIRSLIVELANEREAVLTHAEHVKTTITGAKDQLTREFNSIADHINASAESFTSTLSDTLNMRWGELVDEFNTANEGVAKQLSNKFVETVQSFDASRGRFFEALDVRFEQIDQHTEEASNAVAERLGAKMDDFVKIVHDRTEDVEVRFNNLTGRLANSGEKIIEAVNDSVSDIEKRSFDIDTRLRSTADKVLNDFQNKFNSLDEAIEMRGEKSLATFSQQVTRLENRASELPLALDNLAVASVDQFAQQITKVEEQFALLSGRLAKNGSNVTDAISNSLNEIEERTEDIDLKIKASTERLLNEFDEKFSYVDDSISQKTKGSLRQFSSQISELEKQASDLSTSFDAATNLAIQAFEKRLDQVDESLNTRSTSLIRSFIARTEALEESTDKLNVALDTHVGRINEAFQQRTRDIAQTLTGGRDGILSVVEETKVRLSHEMEIVGTTIAKLVDERAGGFIHQFTEGRERLSSTLEKEAAQIVTTVSTQLELLSRHVNEIEEKILSNIKSVDETTERQSDAFLKRSEKFEATISKSFETARQAVEIQSQNLDVRSTALNDSLKLNSEALNAVLGEQAGVIEARIAHIRDMIAQGNVSFTEALGQHVDLVQSAVLTNDEVLKTTFMNQLERLEDQTSRLKNVFSDNHIQFAKTIDERILGIQETLNQSENTIGDVIRVGREDIKHTLSDGQHSLKETLSGSQAVFEDTLTGSQANFNAIMHNGQNTIKNSLEKSHELIEETLRSHGSIISQQANDIAKAFEQQTAIIDERSSTMVHALESGVTNVRTALEQNALSLSETLRERISEVAGTLKYEAELAENQITQAGEKLNHTVIQSVVDVERRLEERAGYLRENVAGIEAQLSAGFSAIENRVSSTANNLHSESEKAHNIIMSAGQRLAGSVVQAAQNVDEQFNVRDQILKSNMQEIEGQIHAGLDLISSRMADAAANLTNESRVVESNIHAGLNLIANRMADASSNLNDEARKIDGQIAVGLDLISNRMANAAANLTEEARKVDIQLSSRMNNIHEKMVDAASNFNDGALKIEDQLAIGLERINDRIGNISLSLADEAGKAEHLLLNAGDRLSGSVVQAAHAVEQKLSDRSVFLKENINLIEERVTSGLSSIEGRIAEITQKTATHLINKTQNLHGLTEQLQDAAAKTSDSLGILTNQFSNQLKEVTRAAEERLRSENNTFISNFASSSDETVATVKAIKNDISESVAQLLDRLDTSNGTIQQTVNALRNGVYEVDSRLNDVTNEFKKNIGQLSESFTATSYNLNNDLERFNGLSQTALDNVAKFSQQFDNHAKVLTEATGLLDHSHDVFNERLEERQMALGSLANGLVKKSEEISQTMQSCEQVIAAIMKRSEESARASTVQLQSSLSEMVNDASSRFEGATSEIRKSAEEIREELARTRADLSRGVRTLPTQTKEYTEAMRKAVIEQIEALKELSGIVEESGRVFDVSTPAAGAVNQPHLYNAEPRKPVVSETFRTVAPQEQKVAVSQPDLVSVGANEAISEPLPALSTPQFGAHQSNSSLPPIANLPNQQSTPVQPVHIAPMTTSYLNGTGASQANEVSRPVSRNLGNTNFPSPTPFKPSVPVQNPSVPNVPVQQAIQPQNFSAQPPVQSHVSRPIEPITHAQDSKPAPAVKPAQSRGWVSDLLARASRDDVDKTVAPTHVNPVKPVSENAADTLTSMSVDIVQGIDRGAITELWQYYRRGQRNITPNRLYNANGLKIFEKIKHKYALEGEFRRAVSQYITDFERLLGDVTKNGGNNDTVREYLTSDTGKVYTMLAHASGRIQ